jgi:hypothetical protein
MDNRTDIEISEDTVLSWLEKWQSVYPESGRIGSKIWDAFRIMMIKGEADKELLRFLTAQCEDRRTRIAHYAAEKLFHLAKFVPEHVGPCMEELARSRATHVRFASFIACSFNLDSDLVTSLVKAGIKDRSSTVRWKAGEFAAKADLIHLRGDLAEAIRIESDEKTKRSLAHSHETLIRLEQGESLGRNFSYYKYLFTEPSVWS